MAQNFETHVVRASGLTVAAIVWRRFKRPMAGYIERVFAANAGLAATPILPIGTAVRLPVDTEIIEPKGKALAVRLWD